MWERSVHGHAVWSRRPRNDVVESPQSKTWLFQTVNCATASHTHEPPPDPLRTPEPEVRGLLRERGTKTKNKKLCINKRRANQPTQKRGQYHSNSPRPHIVARPRNCITSHLYVYFFYTQYMDREADEPSRNTVAVGNMYTRDRWYFICIYDI